MTVGVLSRRNCSAASPSSIVRRIRRSVSAMMSTMLLLPCRTIDRIDDRVAPRGIVTRVGIVEIFAATHAEPLHQAPAGLVADHGQRDDLLRAKTAERGIERGSRWLPGIALPPGVLAQPPAYFHRVGDRRSRSIGALEPAEAENFTVGLTLDHPKTMAKSRGATFDAGALLAHALIVEHPAQPAHHRRGIGDTEELGPIGIPAPVAQDQPFGLAAKAGHVSHLGAARRARRARSDRKRGAEGKRGAE